MRLTIQVVATCMLLAGAVPPAVAQQDKFPLAAPAGVDSNARRVAAGSDRSWPLKTRSTRADTGSGSSSGSIPARC